MDAIRAILNELDVSSGGYVTVHDMATIHKKVRDKLEAMGFHHPVSCDQKDVAGFNGGCNRCSMIMSERIPADVIPFYEFAILFAQD